MFIYKKLDSRLKSILTSKFSDKKLPVFETFNSFFLVKNKTQDQVLFLFITLTLLTGKIPKLLKSKKKRKNKFLGFLIFFNHLFFYKFIIMYISILDTISILSTKSNFGENRLVFTDFPIIYEVDYICERHNPVLDYIKNFKFVLNLKLLRCTEYSWFYSECFIRAYKFPYLDLIRLKPMHPIWNT